MKKLTLFSLFLIVTLAGIIVFGKNILIKTKVAGISITASKPTAIPINTPTITPTNTLTPTPTLAPSPTSTPSPTLTPTPTLAPIIILPKDLDDLFTKYSSEYSIDKELLKRIANCESSFNTNAIAHGYAGLFQFGEPIWNQTRTLMGQNPDVNLRYNPEEAIRTAAFMVSQNHLGVWPNCSK
ncbi:MAG: transglycosylase SLT domain-containing protein [Actinobacteria bacterium]|nr:transglycosylase SLT domain-containing protein [Actinomycetota bacterium]